MRKIVRALGSSNPIIQNRGCSSRRQQGYGGGVQVCSRTVRRLEAAATFYALLLLRREILWELFVEILRYVSSQDLVTGLT